MTIEEALVHHLKANAGVAAMVTARIYPKKRPQDTAIPAIVFHRISSLPAYSHSGPAGFVAARFQIDCYGKTHVEASSLARAVKAAVDGFNGLMGPAPGVDVQGIFVEDQGDEYDDDQGVPAGIHWQRLDLLIQYGE